MLRNAILTLVLQYHFEVLIKVPVMEMKTWLHTGRSRRTSWYSILDSLVAERQPYRLLQLFLQVYITPSARQCFDVGVTIVQFMYPYGLLSDECGGAHRDRSWNTTTVMTVMTLNAVYHLVSTDTHFDALYRSGITLNFGA